MLSHPLGTIPCSLASADGTLIKTNQAELITTLEKLSPVIEEIPTNSACIIDGMSLVQRITGNHRTFRDVAVTLFLIIMVHRGCSNRITVVFDVYKKKPIKNAE